MAERAVSRLGLREEKIDGIGPWVWPAEDYWGWEQPKRDWPGLRDAAVRFRPGNKAIVCAGAMCGMYPRLWAEHFWTVYAFEPEALNFYCLTLNCPAQNIVKLNTALSDRSGHAPMVLSPAHNAGMHKISYGSGSSVHVPVLPLDVFHFDQLDAIQLDAEGHELHILRGAKQTIGRHKPLITVEDDVPAVRQFLNGMGYCEVARTGAHPDLAFAYEKAA